MSSLNLPIEGSCRCGQVRIKITAAPLLTMACHCTGCQKMTSSAYSLSAAIPNDGFQVTQGDPTIGGIHGDKACHYFCPHCMSWMFTRVPRIDFFVSVRPSMLDDWTWYTPYMETWTSEMLPFATTSAKHSFPKFPQMEDIQSLMKSYAAEA
jgi:hypothetical protein